RAADAPRQHAALGHRLQRHERLRRRHQRLGGLPRQGAVGAMAARQRLAAARGQGVACHAQLRGATCLTEMTDTATSSTPVQIEVPAGRGLRTVWRAAVDPLAAPRELYAAHGPFAVLRLPALGKLNRRLNLPFVVTAGAKFNREVLTNPNTWRMI